MINEGKWLIVSENSVKVIHDRLVAVNMIIGYYWRLMMVNDGEF